MKYLYILMIVLFISCTEKTKENKATDKVLVTDSTRQVEQPSYTKAEDAKGKSKKKDIVFEGQISNFKEVLATIPSKLLPLTENTSFDDFIEAEDYKNLDVNTLQLQKLYPNWGKDGYGFRAIRNYRIEISKTFYSVVITILKGEHEMESVLINYDFNGEIMDSKVVSYDEIAEGQSRIESKISENAITTNRIFLTILRSLMKKYISSIQVVSLTKLIQKTSKVQSQIIRWF